MPTELPSLADYNQAVTDLLNEYDVAERQGVKFDSELAAEVSSVRKNEEKVSEEDCNPYNLQALIENMDKMKIKIKEAVALHQSNPQDALVSVNGRIKKESPSQRDIQSYDKALSDFIKTLRFNRASWIDQLPKQPSTLARSHLDVFTQLIRSTEVLEKIPLKPADDDKGTVASAMSQLTQVMPRLSSYGMEGKPSEAQVKEIASWLAQLYNMSEDFKKSASQRVRDFGNALRQVVFYSVVLVVSVVKVVPNALKTLFTLLPERYGRTNASDVELQAALKELGFSTVPSKSDLDKQFRKLALKHHTDKGGELTVFQRIGDAKETIQKHIDSKPAEQAIIDSASEALDKMIVVRNSIMNTEKPSEAQVKEISSWLTQLYNMSEYFKNSASQRVRDFGNALSQVVLYSVVLVVSVVQVVPNALKTLFTTLSGQYGRRNASDDNNDESTPLLHDPKERSSSFRQRVAVIKTLEVKSTAAPARAFPDSVEAFTTGFGKLEGKTCEIKPDPQGGFTISTPSSGGADAKMPDVRVTKDQVSAVLSGRENQQELAEIMIRGAMAAGMNVKTLQISGGTEVMQAALKEAITKFASLSNDNENDDTYDDPSNDDPSKPLLSK